MPWILLTLAGLFEIGWAIGLKYTDGFTRPVPTVLTVASMIVSIGLLGLALKTLPLGTAYAVWTGVGAVGTAILGTGAGKAAVQINRPASPFKKHDLVTQPCRVQRRKADTEIGG
mgnify:CR=1 FL=1